MTTLALIHTGAVVIKPINDIARTVMPQVRFINYLDDAIVGDIFRDGGITDPVKSRLSHLGQCAADARADAILITCSSISEIAPAVATASGLPVFKIDEAMAEEAVRLGTRIGVLATLPTTLEPTCRLIESKAREAGKAIVIRRELANEAYKQLAQGNAGAHDAILRTAIESLAATEDVIVLAQASMARLLEDPSFRPAVPVLTSPLLGMKRVETRLREHGLLVD
jgi:aspartate/glutamate racemase